MDREECEKILMTQADGTFMFRFSKYLFEREGRNDKIDGGITLSFKRSGLFDAVDCFYLNQKHYFIFIVCVNVSAIATHIINPAIE